MFSERSSFGDDDGAISGLLAAAREAWGEGLVDLTASNPTRVGIEYPDVAAILSQGAGTPYQAASLGLEGARTAVSETYRGRASGVRPDEVVLTASTSEAYSFVLKLLCDPGDQILVPQPSYPLFEHLARLEGVSLAPYRLAYDGAWHVDLESLRQAKTDRCRAVFAVSPNNPTGSYLKQVELEAMYELDLPVVVDEVFRPYRLGSPRQTVAEPLDAPAALTFVLDGLSKRVGLPQMKLGWMVVRGPGADEALRRLEVIADTFLSVSGPVQHAARELLAGGKATRERIQRRIENNLRALNAAAHGTPVSVRHVEGGWYATLRLPAVEAESTYVRELSLRDGLWVHPGWLYDFGEEPVLVLSLLPEEDAFKAAVERVTARVVALSSSDAGGDGAFG